MALRCIGAEIGYPREKKGKGTDCYCGEGTGQREKGRRGGIYNNWIGRGPAIGRPIYRSPLSFIEYLSDNP